MTAARRAVALALVVLASAVGALGALATVRVDRELSLGSVRLSTEPGHRGALDLYVPLVDWGVRFETIRLPARLKIDVRTIDRDVAQRVARGERVDLDAIRDEARDAIVAYLKLLLAFAFFTSLALGLLVALALRSRDGPSLKAMSATALATALALTVALALLLPPRGPQSDPQYYAFGPDIPRALRAVEAATRSTRTLSQELDSQLVGLARLLSAPGARPTLAEQPRLTLASDLHNNALALPILERAADDGPVFFPGDLTDRGTSLETDLVRRAVRTGKPFVFVSGNHDSDTLSARLADDGAVVLTQRGRLRADGSYGPVVNRIAGLRVAGYSDPFERRSAEDFRDRYDEEPSDGQKQAFAVWLRGLEGKADVVMVHEPALIETALEDFAADPPGQALVILVGHTHTPGIRREGSVTVINGGSIGAGGTGNLAEKTGIGVARFVYQGAPNFRPLAADLVRIDPGSGSSTARRERLDSPPDTG